MGLAGPSGKQNGWVKRVKGHEMHGGVNHGRSLKIQNDHIKVHSEALSHTLVCVLRIDTIIIILKENNNIYAESTAGRVDRDLDKTQLMAAWFPGDQLNGLGLGAVWQ